MCEKCTAKIRADQCAETGEYKLKANHFQACANVKKRALDLERNEIVDSIKKNIKIPGFGTGMARDAMLDEGVPKDLLPSVSKVKNYLDHQRNIG